MSEEMVVFVYMWDDTEGHILECDPRCIAYGIQEGDLLEYKPLPDTLQLQQGLYKLTCTEHPDDPKDFEVIEAMRYNLLHKPKEAEDAV